MSDDKLGIIFAIGNFLRAKNFESGPQINQGDCFSTCLNLMQQSVDRNFPGFGNVDEKVVDPIKFFRNINEPTFDRFCG